MAYMGYKTVDGGRIPGRCQVANNFDADTKNCRAARHGRSYRLHKQNFTPYGDR